MYTALMSIVQRVEDAEFLWENSRYEGAFLSAMIAFAATSRRAHPREDIKSDREAFELFFRELFGHAWTVRFKNEATPLGNLIYKWLRCELVHTGGLPTGLQIDPDETKGIFSMTLVEGFPLAVSATLYHSVIINVIGHPINAELFPQQAKVLKAAIKKREQKGQRVLGSYVKGSGAS